MAFKIYRNKKTRHPSVSIKQKDRSKWYNLPMTHKKPSGSFIEIKDPHPKAKPGQKKLYKKIYKKR